MTTQETSYLEHPLLFISGELGNSHPESDLDEPLFLVQKRDLIVVGTQACVDGPVTVILSDEDIFFETSPELDKRLEAVLDTEEEKIYVYGSDTEEIVSLQTLGTPSLIEIWTDCPVQPAIVAVRLLG